jgi:hypothetical protein
MFRLTKIEYDNLRHISRITKLRKRKYNPYVFTEQGVAMLSSILRTDNAINMSIKIINSFVFARKYISNNIIEQKYINDLVLENNKEIKLLKESINKLEEKKKDNEIYFNGQTFDAYSKVQEIFKTALNKLIIIDGYANNSLLDIIKRLNIEVILVTKPKKF